MKLFFSLKEEKEKKISKLNDTDILFTENMSKGCECRQTSQELKTFWMEYEKLNNFWQDQEHRILLLLIF